MYVDLFQWSWCLVDLFNKLINIVRIGKGNFLRIQTVVFSEFFVTPNRVTSLHGARPVNRNDLGMAIRYVPRGAGCT